MKNKIEHNGKFYDAGGGYLASGYMGLFALNEKHTSGLAKISHVGSDGGALLVEFSELIVTDYTTGTITDAPKEQAINPLSRERFANMHRVGVDVYTSLMAGGHIIVEGS